MSVTLPDTETVSSCGFWE